MAISKSLELLGVITNGDDPSYSRRGYVEDNGISINMSGKAVESVGDIPTDVYKNRNKKTSIFNVMDAMWKTNESIGTEIKSPFYEKDISSFKYGKEHYRRDAILEYDKRMQGISDYRHTDKDAKPKALFTFDIETMGQHPGLAPMGKNTKGSEINKAHYAITEVSIWKHYKDENGNWVREKYSGFSSRPSTIDPQALLDAEDADHTTSVTLQRIAGYSDEGAIDDNGDVKYWKAGVDTSDEYLLESGKRNLEKIDVVRDIDDDKYKKLFEERILKPLRDIAQDKDSLLSSINGEAFDIKHIFAEAKALGLEEEYKDVFESHIDTQIIQMQLIGDKVYEEARKNNVNESFKLEDLNEIVLKDEKIEEEVIRRFGNASSHNADYDTYMTGIQAFKTWENAQDEIKKYKEVSMKKIDIGENTVFLSNGAFVSNDSSLHFKVVDGDVNNYNNYLTKRDAAYKVKAFEIKSKDDVLKIIGSNVDADTIPALENIENKVMVELLNALEDEKSFLFFNSIEDAQESLIDRELLQKADLTDEMLEMLKRTHKERTVDNLRRELDNYGSTTSWKKADRLEKLLKQHDIVKNFTIEPNGRKLDNVEIRKLMKGNTINVVGSDGNIEIKPEHVFKEFLVGKKNGPKRLSKEKLRTYEGLYEDLEHNSAIYKSILSKIKSNVSGNYLVSYDGNKTYSKQVEGLKIDDITAAFGNSIDSLESAVISNISDIDKLKYIVNNDKYMKRAYNKQVKLKESEFILNELKKGNKVKPKTSAKEYGFVLSEEDELELLKTAFYKKHRQSFDGESEVAINLLKGRKEITGRSVATSIDIVGKNGEYINVPFRSRGQFTNSFGLNVYSIEKNNRNDVYKKLNQSAYIDDVAYDLYSRGIISEDSAKRVYESNNIAPKIELLTKELFDRKDTAYGYIKKVVNGDVNVAISNGWDGVKEIYDPSKLTNEEFDVVRPFIENRIMVNKYTGVGNTIAGKSLASHLKDLEVAKSISANTIIDESIKRSMTKYSFVGSLYGANDSDFKTMFSQMYEDLSWNNNPSNIKNFEEAIKSYDFNRPINLKGADGVTGLSKMFVKQGEDYKMIITHNRNLVREQLRKGVDIEEIKKNAMIYTLPRVEEALGIKYISQSETQKKLVSDSIAVTSADGEVFKYYMKDTVDEVLEGFKNDFSWAIKHIEDRDYEGANRRIGHSLRNINETKTLTGISEVFVEGPNGEVMVNTKFSPNRADYAKRGLVNYSSLIYDLDTAIDGDKKIGEKLYEYLGTEKANELLYKVKKLKREGLDNKYKIIKDISDLNTDGFISSVFIMDNVKSIATSLLNNEDFVNRANGDDVNRGVIEFLKEMKEIGHVAVNGKESDVSRGYASIFGIHDLVPFSDISNPMRNVQIQSLGSYSIFEDSMVVAAKNLPLKDKVSTADDMYNALGIKPNMGVNTTSGVAFANSKYEHDKTLVGFSAKMKHMTSKEFNDNLIDIHDNEEIHKIIKEKILKEHGIDNVTKEEIQKVAKLISESSSLYEDDGMINILVARSLNPRTVTRENIFEINKELKLGQEIKAGTLLGYDKNGKKIFYDKDDAVIKNLNFNDGKVHLQLNEFYDNVKLNIGGSEKAVFSAPNFKRGTKEYNERMIRIISSVQNHLSGGASIIANPNVKGHGATNTVLIPYISAVAESISSNEDLTLANGVFKDANISFEYDKRRKEYIAVHNPSLESISENPVEQIKNMLNNFSNRKDDFSKRVTSKLKDVKENKIGWMDVFLSSNNTIERGMGAYGYGKGTTSSSRSLVTYGSYRKLNGDLLAEYNGTIFPNLIKEENKLITKANEKKVMQANNVFAAYALQYGEKVHENVNVKKVNIKDVLTTAGTIDASKLDQVFKYNANGERVNVYEVDLSGLDIGFKVDNYFYVDEVKSKAEVKSYGNVDKKTSKIYIPAMIENYYDGNPTLNKTQKSAADLLFNIQQLDNKEQNNRSIRRTHEIIEKKMEEFMLAMDFDLFNKGGLRIQSQKTNETPGTFRVESQKVISPHRKADGTLSDLAFGNLVTKKMDDGTVKYTKSIFVNQETLERLNVDFDMIGNDVLKMQVANELEQVEFLKKYAKNNDLDIGDAKTLNDVQGKLIKSNIDVYDLASNFMEEVGIDAGMSRDPVMRPESFNGVRLRTSQGVQVGGIVMDSLTAQGTKTDSDGDEINVMLKSFFADKNGDETYFALKHYSDEIRGELRIDSEGTSDSNIERLKDLEEGVINSEKKNANIFDIDAFNESYTKGFEASGDYNTSTNEVSQNMRNRINASKNIVGQTSNSGLHLKRAGAAYADELSKVSQPLSRDVRKSIDIGSAVYEQKALDFKIEEFTPNGVRGLDEKLLRAIEMESSWINLHQATRDYKASFKLTKKEQKKAYERLHGATVNVLEILKPYHGQKITSFMMEFESENHNTVSDINDIAHRILKGKPKRNIKDNTVFIEEYVGDVIDLFEDDRISEVYTSMLVRQSKGSVNSANTSNTPHDIAERIIKSRNQSGLGLANDVATRQFSDNFWSDTVTLNGVDLKDGMFVSVDKFTNNIEPGVYKISNNKFDGENRSISLIDTESGQVRTFSHENVFGLRDKLIENGVNVIDGSDESVVKEYYDKAVNMHKAKMANDIAESGYLTDAIFETRGVAGKRISEGKGISAKMQASVNILSEYNLNHLHDLNETLEGLRIMGYSPDRKNILKQMNESLKSKGTKEYQELKRKTLTKDNDLVSKGIVSNASYNKLMGDIAGKVENFELIKASIENVNRINFNGIARSSELNEIMDNVIKSLPNQGQLSTKSIKEARMEGLNYVLSEFQKEDAKAFEVLNSVFARYQHNETFRRDVLGWNLEKSRGYKENGKIAEAIKTLNESVLIYTPEHTGKKLGHLSSETLINIREKGMNTGISSEVIVMNNEIINELLELRKKSDIMLDDIPIPDLSNMADDIGKKMASKMNESTIKKSKEFKRTSTKTSAMSSALDNFKGKVTSMTPKQKMIAGAIAAVGVGATAIAGSQAISSRTELKNKGEDEQLIQSRSSIAKAPPSDKRVYVSDNNAINVNVRGRMPFKGAVDGAERAISSLFGHNVAVNSNISDSRREISDREVDLAMESAIR